MTRRLKTKGVTRGVTGVTHLTARGHAGVTLGTHGGVTLLTIPRRQGATPFRGYPYAGGDRAPRRTAAGREEAGA